MRIARPVTSTDTQMLPSEMCSPRSGFPAGGPAGREEPRERAAPRSLDGPAGRVFPAPSMRYLPLYLVTPALALSFTSCKDDPAPTPAPTAAATAASTTGAATTTTATAAPAASATESAAATGSAAAPPIGPPPACKINAQKSWVKGLNKLTGLTEVELPDGRIAIGFATGNDPQVLVVGQNGAGAVVKVPIKAGSPLASPPNKADGGVRFVMRVTPVKVEGGTAEAFVDYRDEYKKAKRMRVACGPASGDDAWISFDDVPLLDRDPAPAGKDREQLFTPHEAGAEQGYHELRDCRTFADLIRNETWVVGSELLGTDSDDHTTQWRASLVVDKGSKVHELHLHQNELKGAPPKVLNFEVPVSMRAADGSYVLAARYSGSLVVAILNEDKTLRTMKTYPGYPTLPDLTQDGDDIVVAAGIAKPNSKEYLLRALRLSTKHPELPKAMVPIVTDDDGVDSETMPDFTRDAKGRRWMSYVEGERGNGHLEIVPINVDFQAVGRPFEITTEDERASEARVVALHDGSIFVAYLRDKDKSTELVTLNLSCDIVSK
jgi:hypothetical protein